MNFSVVDGKSIKFYSTDAKGAPVGEVYANGAKILCTCAFGVNGNLVFDDSRSIVVGDSSSDKTLTITNAGSGVANLVVEGGITATTLGGTLSATNVSCVVTTLTGNTTLSSSHEVVLCNASSGAFTVTLPAVASSSGRKYYIKKIDSSSYNVTIDANSTETIDGELTVVLVARYDCVEIVCDGSNWYIL